jgi:hypothetical protein
MGALPRLKIKEELRYRKGSTNESANCRYCEHFKRDFLTIHRADMVVTEHRCAVIGVREGARYRIRQDHTCDRQRFDEFKKNW